MWMRGKIAHSICQHRMWHPLHVDPLIITVRTGMIVRPEDRRSIGVVDASSCRVGLRTLRVKKVRRTYAVQPTEGPAQIHVIASYQQASAFAPEFRNSRAILLRESISRIHGEKPQFVVVR